MTDVLTFDNGQDALEHVQGVLASPDATVGAVIAWDGAGTLVGGNLRRDRPGVLWPVYIDDQGRLWKEEHPFREGVAAADNRLVCILDLRGR